MKRTSDLLILGTLASLLWAVLLWHNAVYLIADIAPHTDIAADMLLIERAQHDWLLTGHYSRFGFHHPGPFFLWPRHLAQLVLGNLLGSPYSAQLVAVIGINAAFAGLAGATAAAVVGLQGRWALLGGMAALVPILLQDTNLGLLSYPWMPFQLVIPFAAFILLLAGLGQGHLAMLPAATLCGCVLVHGYVPLTLFVGLPWLLAVVCYLWQQRRRPAGSLPARAWPWLTAGVIIAIFVAPMMLDMVLDPPGNLILIWHVGQAITPSHGTELRAILAFVSQFWLAFPDHVSGYYFATKPVLWLLAAVGAGLAWWDTQARTALLAMLTVVSLMTLLMLVYAWRAPGPILPFIASFYLGTPLALIALLCAAGAKMLIGYAPRISTAGLIGCCLALAYRGPFLSPPQHIPGIRELTQGVLADQVKDPDQPVRLRFANHDHWPFVAGLLLDLGRHGITACAEAAHLAVLFSPERVCPLNGGGRTYAMVAAADCLPTNCIVRADSLHLGLARPPPIPPYLIGQRLGFTPSDDSGAPYQAGGWSTADGDGTFSHALEAQLMLPITDMPDGDLELRLQGWSFVAKELPQQRITVLVNGQKVADWVYSIANARGERRTVIPHDIAVRATPMRILFQLPDAASPASLGISADARQLGLGLHSLVIQSVQAGFVPNGKAKKPPAFRGDSPLP